MGVSAGYYIVLNFWTVIDREPVGPAGRCIRRGKPTRRAVRTRSSGDYRAWLVIPALLRRAAVHAPVRRASTGCRAGRWRSSSACTPGSRPPASRRATSWRRCRPACSRCGSGHSGASLNAILFTVGLVTSLLFFFYSREHKGVLGGVSRVGRVVPDGVVRRRLRLHRDVAHLAADRALPVPARATGSACVTRERGAASRAARHGVA